MEKDDWQNPEHLLYLLRYIHDFASRRKLLLIASEFVRVQLRDPENVEAKDCADIMEREADQNSSPESLRSELGGLPGNWRFTHIMFRADSVEAAKDLRKMVAFSPAYLSAEALVRSDLVILDLIEEVLGPDPSEPVAFAPEWRTSTVTALAEAIYADRTFCNLPILADALEDAGCDHADILSHCRGLGPHVRGCWVVDLVLGKS